MGEVVPVVACWGVALATAAALHLLTQAAFGPLRSLPEAWDRPAGHLVLWVGGLLGAAAGLLATYRALRWGGPVRAIVTVLLLLLPLFFTVGCLVTSLVVGAAV